MHNRRTVKWLVPTLAGSHPVKWLVPPLAGFGVLFLPKTLWSWWVLALVLFAAGFTTVVISGAPITLRKTGLAVVVAVIGGVVLQFLA